jgi:hypothetical protein
LLAWRALIPISLGLLVATAVIMYFWTPMATSDHAPLRIDGWTALILLAGNVLVLLLSMWISMLIPPPPQTNRKIRVAGSRFSRTPVPVGA